MREEKRKNDEARARVLDDFKSHVEAAHRKFRDPRKMIDKKVKNKIILGENFFKRDFGNRQGY